MITVPIPGNIEIEVTGHESLFDLIYRYSSDDIALKLNNVVDLLSLDINDGKKDELVLILKQLEDAFIKIKEEPIVLLIRE